MVTLNIHVRQDLGQWSLTAVLVEDYGAGLEPDVSSTSWQGPLTGPEWDAGPLEAVLSAVARWSGMTIDGFEHARLA